MSNLQRWVSNFLYNYIYIVKNIIVKTSHGMDRFTTRHNSQFEEAGHVANRHFLVIFDRLESRQTHHFLVIFDWLGRFGLQPITTYYFARLVDLSFGPIRKSPTQSIYLTRWSGPTQWVWLILTTLFKNKSKYC